MKFALHANMNPFLLIAGIVVFLPLALYWLIGVRGFLYGMNVCLSSLLAVVASRLTHFSHTWIFLLAFLVVGAFFSKLILSMIAKRKLPHTKKAERE